MRSILLFNERRKLEIRRPVLNFEITDSSFVPVAEGSANAHSLNLVLQNSKLVFESLNFHFSFRKPISFLIQINVPMLYQSID